MPISFPVRTETVKVGKEPIQVFYPRAVNMADTRLERYINQAIESQTQQLIDLQVGNMPSTVEEMLGTYELKNNQRQVLSLSLSNYTYHYQAAHGMTFIKSLTFDLKEGKLDSLSDLFTPGSNYEERLNTLISEQIIERDVPLLEDFPGIKPDQDFYIADKCLVIYFQLYDLTPYVYGFPMFPISVYDLQDIIREDGPLGRMAENN
ncbi:DUF3298 and DUF4163 domain-containing protein [Sediminibacillus massiliensis]|uniref:DUF3298 and DUF4163 domain-containing protein n=1 Tax=Sediminibacillus massiliensis TaxID=1926277 RepID=UPI0009883785|nr:DUF3298 and DUF4163 domain-containing protein [Sediminibacillus massiliensis]